MIYFVLFFCWCLTFQILIFMIHEHMNMIRYERLLFCMLSEVLFLKHLCSRMSKKNRVNFILISSVKKLNLGVSNWRNRSFDIWQLFKRLKLETSCLSPLLTTDCDIHIWILAHTSPTPHPLSSPQLSIFRRTTKNNYGVNNLY